MAQDSPSLSPACLQTTNKDKVVSLCTKLIPASPALSAEEVKRKLFTGPDSPLRKVTLLNSRSKIVPVFAIVALVGIIWIQVLCAKAPTIKRSEKEFIRIQRASEMVEIIRNINQDVLKIYETLPSLYYDVSGIANHKENHREWRLTSEKILFDSESADHVDDESLAPALVRPRGWDLKLPFTGDKERKNTCWMDKKDLLCVPKFYFMGFPHSRARDIFKQLQSHPLLMGSPPQNWWTKINFKVKISSVCTNYGKVMANASKEAVLGDLDEMQILHLMNRIPDTVFKNMDWHKNPAAPRLMTPYMIRAMYPEIKFVVVLQNPIDAVYLAFLNADSTEKRSAQLFHYRAVQLTNLYSSCFQRDNIRACVYDPLLAMEAAKAEIPVNTQFHAVVLGDWLQVFKMEHFHFFRLEDYEDDKRLHLDGIYQFVGLTTPDWKTFKPVKEESLKVPGDLMEPMWPQTREVLKQFFKPHLLALSSILDSDKYLWDEFTAEERLEE